MAALTSAAFTVAITDQVIVGKKRFVFGTLTLTNTSSTYPTAGVPLPAIGNFGMVQRMDMLLPFGNNALTSDYQVRYNKSGHALLLYENASATGPLPECDTSETPATRTYDFLAIGW